MKNKKRYLYVIVLILIGDITLATAYFYMSDGPVIDRQLYRVEQMLLQPPLFRNNSPHFHHGLKAKVHVKGLMWRDLDYNIHTNSLGFKDKSTRDVTLKNSRRRIVFLGDSFTEGIGYDYEKTFVGIIDKNLHSENIEVLNAGVTSYSPLLYWKKMEHLLETVKLKIDDVIVYLDVSDAYDEALCYDYKDGKIVDTGHLEGQLIDSELLADSSTNQRRRFVRNHSMLLYSLLYKISDAMGEPVKLNNYGQKNQDRSLWTVDDLTFFKIGDPGLQKMTTHMNELKDLLQKHQVKLTIAVYPWPDQILHQDLNSRHVNHWKSWAEKNQVTFINHFPDFINTQEDKKKVLQDNFITNDVHWNDKGHQKIAKSFLKQFIR